jgi:hypothetical protein
MTKRSDQLDLIKTPRRIEEEEPSSLRAWALVELFGHKRIVGQVTVDPVEFPGMIRVDVPDLIKEGKVVEGREGFTRYVGRAALYGVTPITEQAVRELLPNVDGKPARSVYLRGGDY